MDLSQRKLTKSEWEGIEIPVGMDEIEILNLIVGGYDDVNIKYNKHSSLLSFLKMTQSSNVNTNIQALEDYLYKKYFSEKVGEFVKKYGADFLSANTQLSINIKKADMIRLEKNTVELVQSVGVYEYVLLDQVEKLLKNKKKKGDTKWQFHYYTLYYLMKNHVYHINRHITFLAKSVLSEYENEVDFNKIVEKSAEYVEQNTFLLKYGDITLYQHQKQIFTACKNPGPKLVLYIAPTGTGKTMTPLGLLNNHKVIFVCAARHVGLALAKSAISINKRVAFAFGCASADDIRLHYFAAKDYTKHKKTGGIWKVDNSNGEKVEMIICDIKSYLPAMYYMLAFFDKEKIVTYWDEPTITLDYETHEFHDIIQKNWKENLIPNMILSSATLPKLHELPDTICDFKEKFDVTDDNIFNIVSHDCKKSIPLLNKDGYIVLPHMMSENYDEVLQIVQHCENYLTLLRYFDVEEVAKFIVHVHENNYIPNSVKINRYFASLDDINMINIKLYYLRLLRSILSGTWGAIYISLYSVRKRRIVSNDGIDARGNKIRKTSSIGPGVSVFAKTTTNENDSAKQGAPLIRMQSEQITSLPSQLQTQPQIHVESGSGSGSGNFGVYITTKDAYTLTDGPTIFLAKDVEKIGKFCVQQANIPSAVMTELLEKIDYNNKLNEKIVKLERDLEDKLPKEKERNDGGEGGAASMKKSTDKTKKMDRVLESSVVAKIKCELDMLYSMIKSARLNDVFVPNKSAHLEKWTGTDSCCADELREFVSRGNAFTCHLEEETIIKIMKLGDISDVWKILLLMGIGVFTNHESITYTEIMKQLAEQQKLYIIIASSDYIYGTNYQFCHGYLSKDMEFTQEKIIQAMGRIGRNNIQQQYTVRFRDDSQIEKLFKIDAEKPEMVNMNRLFYSGSA